MNGDKYKYGTLIAKFMGERIKDHEEKELNEWICRNDGNMKLFEDLTNDYNADWARKWFAEAGVKTRFIKWKKMDGWYKPEPNPRRWFYIVTGISIAFMIIVYLMLRFID